MRWSVTERGAAKGRSAADLGRRSNRLRNKLAALRPAQVQRCYAELLDAGLSPASVHKVHVTLHGALRHAVRVRLIARNP